MSYALVGYIHRVTDRASQQEIAGGWIRPRPAANRWNSSARRPASGLAFALTYATAGAGGVHPHRYLEADDLGSPAPKHVESPRDGEGRADVEAKRAS